MDGSRKRVWSDCANGAEDTERAGGRLATRTGHPVSPNGDGDRTPGPRAQPGRTTLSSRSKTRQLLLYPETKPRSSKAQTQPCVNPGQELAAELASAVGTSRAAGSQPMRPEPLTARLSGVR